MSFATVEIVFKKEAPFTPRNTIKFITQIIRDPPKIGPQVCALIAGKK